MAKRPATQFYWGDWRRDTALRACSLEARGLWIDLLCVMHDGEPYGHLAVNGIALTDPEIAPMMGLALPRYRRILAELEAKGVLSRTENGTIYSRRMVRDERVREVRANGGGQSLHNPNVPRPKRRKKGPGEGYPSDHPSDHPSGGSFDPSPAVAVASASATELPSNTNNGAMRAPDRAEPAASWPILHAKLPATGMYRHQVMTFIASLPEAQAEGWCALLLQTLAGIGTPGGVAVTPDELLTTLATYMASRTGDHDTRYFAGCLRNVVKRRYASSAKPTERPMDATADASRRLPRLTDPDLRAAS